MTYFILGILLGFLMALALFTVAAYFSQRGYSTDNFIKNFTRPEGFIYIPDEDQEARDIKLQEADRLGKDIPLSEL